MGKAVITSYQNAKVKHFRRLARDAEYRREHGLYIAEGSTLLKDALLTDNAPYYVALGEYVRLEELPDTEIVTMTEEILNSISTLVNPEGIISVCPIPPAPEVPPRKGRWLLLDRVQDPGNVGSIQRTAQAFGLDGILLMPGCADPYNPKAVRAAMGATLRLPAGVAGMEELRACPLPVFAADMWGTPFHGQLPEDCIVALGSEGQGISPDLRRLASKVISIPMPGKAESLGVAAAAAILCWEMSKAIKTMKG
jgi:TrmH family RNA methyltransferase